MFPGAHAVMSYNADGEPIGWDVPSFDPPGYYDESDNLYGDDDDYSDEIEYDQDDDDRPEYDSTDYFGELP